MRNKGADEIRNKEMKPVYKEKPKEARESANRLRAYQDAVGTFETEMFEKNPRGHSGSVWSSHQQGDFNYNNTYDSQSNSKVGGNN